MFEEVIFPFIMILGSFLYLINIHKRRGGFLKEESIYSNSMSLKVWLIGAIIFVAGFIFLIKGLIKYF